MISDSDRNRIARVLILLAPIALASGIALRWTRPAPDPLAFQYDRDGFIELGRQAARAQGFDVSSWRAVVHIQQSENEVRRYGGDTSGRFQFRARVNPQASVDVRFSNPGDQDQSLHTRFGPSGRLLEWSTDVSVPGGRNLSEQALHDKLQPELAAWLRRFGSPTLTDWRNHESDQGAGYEAKVAFAEAPGERYRIEAGVRGDRLVSASIHDENRTGEGGFFANLEGYVGFCGFTLTGFFFVYSLRLYRLRKREGEIPRERVWVLIAIFGLCGALFVALNIDSVLGGSGMGTFSLIGRAILAGLGTSLLYGLGGLFVAMAYASGEGQVREGWPGKLIALDALLAGRWFTKPVGTAAVVSGVVASWAFFIASCAWRLGPPQAAVFIDNDLLSVALGQNVLARSLVDMPLRVSFLLVAGLFMPLAFAHRRRWHGWKVWLGLVLCALFVDGAFRSFSLSSAGPLITTVGTAVALIAPFYFCDVLASVLGILLYAALTSATLVETAVPVIATSAALFLAVFVLAWVPLIAAARRGSSVDERAVLPRYARNLAERLSLQAEVSSAREAQLRLLPLHLPQHPGVSVAAYCRPAGVVGGDFYDFFPAPGGRMAVFVASGSGLGLASALTIALAKGFLASEVRRGEAPGACLAALLTALSGRVGAAGDQTGLLLAMVDPIGNEVKIARRGQYPSVWLMRGRDCSAFQFQNPPSDSVDTGTLAWQSGDALLFSTEGFSALLDDRSVAGQRDWLRSTSRRTEGAPAQIVEQDMTRRLGGRRGKRLRKLRRDLTTVILRNQPA